MEWISVQNKLPEEKEVVVVYQEWKNAVTLGYWFEMFPNVKFWQALRTPYDAAYDIPWVGAGRVTHWMPLPEPPKEGRQ